MSARKHPLPAEKARMAAIVDRLKAVYPYPVCALEWQSEASLSPEATEADRLRDSWRLLVMARLSAQCTDARVNIVCRDLFARYDTPAELGKASQEDIEAIIRPCGLFRTKAESIRAACRILAEDYGGIVPDDMDALLALPGVGRKIANLLLGDLFGRPAIDLPKNFGDIVRSWERKEISFDEALKLTSLSESTFYRRLRDYRATNGKVKK